jgi:arginyl-tRNA synthetase
LIVQEKRGLNKGAWVMRFGENAREDKILVKSDGTATYTAKDIAYHLWKFGLAKADFNYAIWNKQENGEMLWTTKEGSDKKAAHPKNKFGHADKVINVIDARQAYPQNIVKEALRRLGFKQQAANYRHLAYGVVYLSAKSLETLGYVIPKNQEEKSSFAISGRAGIGVMADDLMAKVEEKVRKINPKLNAAEIKHLSAAIIRYYLLSLRPEKDVTFDIDAALQVDGNTGAYLQYAYARACHILQKAKGRPSPLRLPTILSASETALLKQLTFLEEVIDEAAENLNPSLLCDYLWNLANGFAKFYETSPVLSSEEPARSFRLRLTAEVKTTLATGLQLLGITPLEKI